MPVRLARGFLVAMLVVATGGHWVLLQTAAWVGMTIDYSQNDSLLGALKKTFDGKHPCQLCRLISKETKSEKKPDLKPIQLKLEFLAHATEPALEPRAFPLVCSPSLKETSRSEPPPLPPPRPASV
jgi:hypothetical protein